MSDHPHEIEVPLPGGAVRLRGALDLERTAAGWRPRRLPRWTRPQLPSAFCELVVTQPSGARLVFDTEATTLALEVLVTKARYADALEPSPGGVFELVVDGRPVERVTAPDGAVLEMDATGATARLRPGPVATVGFAALPPGRKQVEIWLPQSAQIELVDLHADAPPRPPEPVAGPVAGPVWIHHGSSISHCMEADGPLGSWPVLAARLAGADVLNLGFAGNAMLDPFTARTIRDLPADLISLKLGINLVNGAAMRLRAFEPAVHGFLDTVRDGHPATPLLLISPIACPIVEDRPGPTRAFPDGEGLLVRALGDPADVADGALTLTVIRRTLRRIVADRAHSDPHLHYLDGRELFGPADVHDLPDALHPNAAGYRRMGERFAARAFTGHGPFARVAAPAGPRVSEL